MQNDLLQQLRDIHLPADPSWFPPAPGWWVLVVFALGLLLWAAWRIAAWQEARKPIKSARRIYLSLCADRSAGALDDRDFLHAVNELLKRLLIHGLGEQEARRANDQTWLELLDQRSETTAFSQGAGRALGNQRFGPEPEVDLKALHAAVIRLFRRVLRRCSLFGSAS